MKGPFCHSSCQLNLIGALSGTPVSASNDEGDHVSSAAPRPPAATIYSVAAAAGVSIASVSRALQGSSEVSERTRAKVLAAAAKLNYVPLAAARSLAVRHHEAFALVLPELDGPYFSELMMGFEAQASELGHSVVLLMTAGKPDLERAVRQTATRVDGLAVLGSGPTGRAVVAALGAAKPVLFIAGDDTDDVEGIRAENLNSARDLTTHLIEHGRHRLVFVGDPTAAPDVRDRYEGFALAHQVLGRAPAPPVRVGLRERDGIRFAQTLLAGDDAHDADALVCANDELALAIMDRLTRAGRRVPADIAVVGWDDVMAARYVRPGLTTVRQPVRRLGELAATRLHGLLRGTAVEHSLHVLPTDLVLRGSCGCAEPPPPAWS